MAFRICRAASAVFILCSLLICSAEPAAADAVASAKLEVGFWGGVSAGPTPTVIGKGEDVRFDLLAVRLTLPILRNPSGALIYTVDVVPFARLSYRSPAWVAEPGVQRSAHGAGIAPAGIGYRFHTAKNIQPCIGFEGGFLYLNHDVPRETFNNEVLEGKRFNFTGALNAGLRVHLSDRVAIEGGWKYYHLSNGYRGNWNPGFDSNLWHLGLSWSVR